MRVTSRAVRKLNSVVAGVTAITMCVPALSSVAQADEVESSTATNCKQVLADWGLITVTGGVISETVNLSTTYLVDNINQLFCLGAGAYKVSVDGTELTTEGISDCSGTPTGEKILAELMHAKYLQTQDLDFNDLTVSEATDAGALKWRPIGNNGCQFMGEYDGNNKRINDLYLNEPALRDTDRAYEGFGLFGSTGDNGQKPSTSSRTTANIKNVIVDNITMIGYEAVGGIVGIADKKTNLSNVSVIGIVGAGRKGSGSIGGLIGWANGEIGGRISISNSKTNVRFSIVEVSDPQVDGNCVGGYVGEAYATDISDSTTQVYLRSDHAHEAGGFVGCMYGGSISNSSANGTIRAGNYLGGVVGSAYVFSQGTSEGLDVDNVFADVAVGSFGNEAMAGGLIGWADSTTIDTSLAVGAVRSERNSESAYAGGLVGGLEGSANVTTNSFWDVETTGVAMPEDPSAVAGVGLLTSDLRSLSTFTGAGWDIVDGINSQNIWGIVDGKNGNYPFLQTFGASPTCMNVLEDWGMISVSDNETSSISVLVDPSETYQVSTIDQLYCIGEGSFALGGDLARCDYSRMYLTGLLYASYVQTADLDFNDLNVSNVTDWRPIGTNECQFGGTYDGNGFDIANLRMDQANFHYQHRPYIGFGLFGSTGRNDKTLNDFVDQVAVIKNVNLVDVDIEGHVEVGGLIGIASYQTEVQNSFVSGVVKTSNTSFWIDLGGLIGYVTANPSNPVLVKNSGTDVELGVIELLSTRGNETTCAGGLVGYADWLDVDQSSVEVSSATPNGDSVGGIVGCMYGGSIRSSHTSGTISVRNGGGGLAGDIGPAEISNSYSTVNVQGNGAIGGLLGWFSNVTMSNSYAIGSLIAAPDQTIGGLGGETYGAASTVTHSFWDVETSGQPATGDPGLGKITSEMKALSTFTDAEWDIVEGRSDGHIWGIDAAINDGYPFLQVFEAIDPAPENPNNPTGDQNAVSTPTVTSSPVPVRNRKWMEARTIEEFAQITPTDMSAMPISAIRGIKKTHAAVMTRAQFMALSPAQLRVMRPGALVKIPATWIAALNAKHLSWLLPRQINALSAKQMQKLTTKQQSLIASVMSKATRLMLN